MFVILTIRLFGKDQCSQDLIVEFFLTENTTLLRLHTIKIPMQVPLENHKSYTNRQHHG